MKSFTLPYPPSTNNLFRTDGRYRVKTREAIAYAKTAAAMALAAGVRPLVGPVTVNIDVYRPRRSGDLDNRLKAVIDSLKGIAWADDEQVDVIIARRFEDKKNPRVEIAVAGTISD